eukprot:5796199-Pyramimonas_sp.AAC.1
MIRACEMTHMCRERGGPLHLRSDHVGSNLLSCGIGCLMGTLAEVPRSVAFVEVHAGEGDTARKVREKGFVSYTMDKKAGDAQD